MIRLKAASKAKSLQGEIPELAILRMTQFEGDDNCYDPDIDGYLIIIEEGDDVERDVPEGGEFGLLTHGQSQFEYVRYSIEKGQRIFEAVMVIDNEKTVVIFIPESVPIDNRLRAVLIAEAEYEPNM